MATETPTTPLEHRAAKAQAAIADSPETLADSAETQQRSALRQEKSALRQEDSAVTRTRLAADRTLLAAERTYAAWMRTGLASLAAGIGAKSLLDKLVHPWLVMATATMLLLFSLFCFAAGVWREVSGNAVRPDPDVARLPGWLLIVFNGFMIVVGAAVLVGVLTT